MTEKLLYSMGEVAEMFDVKASLIRHWEAYFDVLKPQRNKKGNRLFTVQDVEYLKVIHHLVKERGMTLEGARRALRRQRGVGDGTNHDTELLERLQRIRALLLEVREELRAGSSEGIAIDDAAADEPSAEAPAAPARRKAVVHLDDVTGEEVAPEPSTKEPSASRRPRRKKESGETKELFAFYEQSLF